MFWKPSLLPSSWKKHLHVGPLRSSYSQSLGATETVTSVGKLLKTEGYAGYKRKMLQKN